jgi:23S rRNA (pseudouridine1915-N3)-methyltransferase
MHIEVWWIGSTHESSLREGIEAYQKRIAKMVPVRWETLSDPKKAKSMSQEQRQQAEAELVLKKLQPGDHLVLLEERGSSYTSETWASWLEGVLNAPGKKLVLLIGGAYGHHPTLRQRSDESLSLSPMTFTHEMTRLILAEQLYRALTILKNINYHY